MAVNSKRIAKNTIMLYIRMIIATLVGLYTTRVVLEVLGVTDYGIYTVVGGVTAFLGFIKSSLSSSTSRFYSFEMGGGDFLRLKKLFSTSLLLHIFFGLVILLLFETIGYWFLDTKLSIPADRMAAAKWVYQCSIITSVLTFVQVPYNAAIVSHEDMGVFAYIELLNVGLKLLIVYLLEIGNFDKLELYATLSLAVTLIISWIYLGYSWKHYPETHTSLKFDRLLSKKMLGFSFWQMFSSFSMSLKTQGQNFLMNIYYGVRLNASLGISSMLYGTLTSLSYNMLAAFQPPIYKAYAAGEEKEFNILVGSASMMCTLILAVVTVPFLLNVNFILNLWLKNVPQYVNEICAIALIFNGVGISNSVVTLAINATGKNRNRTLITGCSFLIGFFILWGTLWLKLPLVWAFIAFYAGTPLMFVGNLILVKRQIPFLRIRENLKPVLKIWGISVLVYVLVYIFKYFTGLDSWWWLFTSTLLSIPLFGFSAYWLVLNDTQRGQAIVFLRSKVLRRKM